MSSSLLWSARGEGAPTKLVFCLLAGNLEPTTVARYVRWAANPGEGRKVFPIGDRSDRVLWGVWPPGRCLMLSSGGPLGSRLHSTRFASLTLSNTATVICSTALLTRLCNTFSHYWLAYKIEQLCCSELLKQLHYSELLKQLSRAATKLGDLQVIIYVSGLTCMEGSTKLKSAGPVIPGAGGVSGCLMCGELILNKC